MDHLLTDRETMEYRSRMSNWNERASVRVTPMRKMATGEGGDPFSSDLIPLLAHPLVQERGEPAGHIIRAQKLFTYLEFTEHLERKAVIPACTMLAHDESPFRTPRSLQRDASKIIVDEAHHAECAGDLTDEMVAVTGISPYRMRVPGFLSRLECVLANTPPEKRRLVLLTFASVSETLITGTLVKLPTDLRVNATIRSVIRDHALDEAKHHACFTDVIRIMWEQIDPADRDICGPLFAKFVHDFLAPDIAAELGWLEAAGFGAKEARTIIENTHVDVRADIRGDAAPTISLMKRFGLVDHQATVDALGLYRLL